MREKEFRNYLEEIETISSKTKAINSRISRAIKAELLLNASLDEIVASDDRMYHALCLLNEHPAESNGNLQNAVRWYYKFTNGNEFPRLLTYKRRLRYR